MKKILLLVFLCLTISSLVGCRSWREELLAPPDEIEIPEGSSVASCKVDNITHKYIFKEDGVYQYFINNIEQNEEILNSIQEQAFLHDESVQNYLDDEYGEDGCVVEDYIDVDLE